MIRAGARNPQPPPLPPTPSPPSPHKARPGSQTNGGRGRLLDRARCSENLRDRVVHLAQRREQTGARHDVQGRLVDDPATSPRQTLSQPGVTVLLYDLAKDGDGDEIGASSLPHHPDAAKSSRFLNSRFREKVTAATIRTNKSLARQASRVEAKDATARPSHDRKPRSSPESPHSRNSSAGRLGPSPRVSPRAYSGEKGDEGDHGHATSGRAHHHGFDAKASARASLTHEPVDGSSSSSGSPRSTGLSKRQGGQQAPGEAGMTMPRTSGHAPTTPKAHLHGSTSQPSLPLAEDPCSGRRVGGAYPHPRRQAPSPAPPPGEPQKRVRPSLGRERRGPRPKSVKIRPEDCCSHYLSSGTSGDSPRQAGGGGVEAVGEVVGSAVPPSPSRSHLPHSPRRNFAASLEMFKRRLKMNQRGGPREDVMEQEDYVIRLTDSLLTNPPNQHLSHTLNPHPPKHPPQQPFQRSVRGQSEVKINPDDLCQVKDGADRKPSDGQCEGQGCQQEEVEATFEGYTSGLSCDTSDLHEEDLSRLWDCSRSPLPRVKTYVVDEAVARNLQGCGLPLALTRHNVNVHDSVLTRRLQREWMRLRREEVERRAAGQVPGGGGEGGVAPIGAGRRGGGPGFCGVPDDDWRTRSWLRETERQQREFQPLGGFKVALPAA